MLDFLGIGAQKAGTTWLYRNLDRHPKLRFPAGKELHFWDLHREQGMDWWLAHFAQAEPGVRQGEITPAYAMLDTDSIARIAGTCPGVRLFYSVRNPIERAWSSALMALERAEMTESEASDPWFLDHFRSRGSLARGDYAGSLRRWWSVFGREPLQVICFDDICADPRGVLKQLARHLDVEPDFFDGMSRGELRTEIFRGPRVPIRPSLAASLGALYGERIDALSALLERDLSHWKSCGRGEGAT